jgi:hypothetical protein
VKTIPGYKSLGRLRLIYAGMGNFIFKKINIFLAILDLIFGRAPATNTNEYPAGSGYVQN